MACCLFMLAPAQSVWAVPVAPEGPGTGSTAGGEDPPLGEAELPTEQPPETAPAEGGAGDAGDEAGEPGGGSGESPGGAGDATPPVPGEEPVAPETGAGDAAGNDPAPQSEQPGVQPSQAQPIPAATVPSAAEARGRIIGETNTARVWVGKTQLRSSPALDAIAQAWSVKQAQARKMSHNPVLGSELPGGWSRAAENVAFGYGYAEVTEAWINSPSHYQNITGDYTHVGIGVAYDTYGFPYATQVFAKYVNGVPGEAAPVYPRVGQSFRDVPPGHLFFGPVEWMAKRGYVVTGGSNQDYNPTSAMTRGAMATVLMRRVSPNFVPPANLQLPYRDVSKDHLHYRGIAWMYLNGYAAPATAYNPGNAVTRGAMATFLYRMNGGASESIPRRSYYADVPDSNVHAPAIAWMAAKGYATSGIDTPNYHPANATTRGAMAAFLYRVYG